MKPLRRSPATRRFAPPRLRGLLLAAAWAGCAAATDPWPERVVGIEQMPVIGTLKLSVPTPRAIDRKRTSTVVLQVHVDADGLPVRSRIEQSSGNPNIDEAVLHAVRTARFKPLAVDGAAQPATLVLPVQVPFQERPR